MSENSPDVMSEGETAQLNPRHKSNLHQVFIYFEGHSKVDKALTGVNWDNSGVRMKGRVYLRKEVLPYG